MSLKYETILRPGHEDFWTWEVKRITEGKSRFRRAIVTKIAHGGPEPKRLAIAHARSVALADGNRWSRAEAVERLRSTYRNGHLVPDTA